MPLFFTGATALLIFGVMKVLKQQGRGTKDPKPEAADITAMEKPDPENSNGPSNPRNIGLNALIQQPLVESLPAVEQSELRPSAASEAISILESFLRARSLEERIPIMETREAEGDLEDSVLAKTLPTFRNLIIESQESFPLENIVDFYFSFEFIKEDGSADPQTVAVRRRGDFNPRVLADPFLDLYGGRLAAYAAKPQLKGQFFHVIANPIPSCTELRIPNRQKKITLRLFSHQSSSQLIQAYASRVSKIGELLNSGNYDLNYGKPKACVLLLGWNTEENPNEPYLEALDIKSFHWNP